MLPRKKFRKSWRKNGRGNIKLNENHSKHPFNISNIRIQYFDAEYNFSIFFIQNGCWFSSIQAKSSDQPILVIFFLRSHFFDCSLFVGWIDAVFKPNFKRK